MLQLLVNSKDKQEAQDLFYKNITDDLSYQGKRSIGYQGGGGEYPLYSNGPGELYYAYGAPHDRYAIRRHWNSFGIYRPGENFSIVVEINIPTEINTKQVAGFFARDPTSGRLLVMHSGRVGGGRPGIGREAYLRWSGAELVETANGAQNRIGIIVGDVGGPCLVDELTRFVRSVDSFKRAATSGGL